MLERFGSTVDRIYSAATGGTRWEDALLAIEELTGCAGAVIDLIPMSPGHPAKTLSGSFSEENCVEYARDYQAICPRIRRAVQHPERAAQFDHLFMTERDMDRDPVYDWLGRHGLRYYVGGPIARTPNYTGFLSLQRTRRQGHVDAQDIGLFELLQPHVARAASLADQLGTLRTWRKFGSAMLEGLPQAVFALDSKGAVLFANGAAAELVAGRDAFRIEQGYLRVAVGAEQLKVEAMVRAALSSLEAPGRGWIRVSRPSGAPPYAMFVAPLAAADEELIAAEARVLVIIHDTGEHRRADPQMLISLYGLTHAEAQLASALSAGHSLESAAALLGIQPATARGQLKPVFRKICVTRQQELVRVLTSLRSLAAEPNHAT